MSLFTETSQQYLVNLMQIIPLCLNVNNVTNKNPKHNCLIKLNITITATSFISVCYIKHNRLTHTMVIFARQASIHHEYGLKDTIGFVMSVYLSVCPSIHPRVTTQLPLDGLS